MEEERPDDRAQPATIPIQTTLLFPLDLQSRTASCHLRAPDMLSTHARASLGSVLGLSGRGLGMDNALGRRRTTLVADGRLGEAMVRGGRVVGLVRDNPEAATLLPTGTQTQMQA